MRPGVQAVGGFVSQIRRIVGGFLCLIGLPLCLVGPPLNLLGGSPRPVGPPLRSFLFLLSGQPRVMSAAGRSAASRHADPPCLLSPLPGFVGQVGQVLHLNSATVMRLVNTTGMQRSSRGGAPRSALRSSAVTPSCSRSTACLATLYGSPVSAMRRRVAAFRALS
jgi:hypothetical protein